MKNKAENVTGERNKQKASKRYGERFWINESKALTETVKN